MNIKVSKEILSNKLKHSIQKIKFTKVDGSLRDMICSLSETHLPPLKELSENITVKPKKENLDTIIVYDLEKEAWRTIRLDSIISFDEVAENTTSG